MSSFLAQILSVRMRRLYSPSFVFFFPLKKPCAPEVSTTLPLDILPPLGFSPRNDCPCLGYKKRFNFLLVQRLYFFPMR